MYYLNKILIFILIRKSIVEIDYGKILKQNMEGNVPWYVSGAEF